MTDLGKGLTGDGAEPPGPGIRSGMPPFFPGPAGGGPPHPSGAPPVPAPAPPPSPPPPRPPGGPPAGPAPATTAAVVKGRITIEDEVVEKIATLAALDVAGVAMLAGQPAGSTPARPGVRIHLHDNEVTLDIGLVVDYGCVVMDVAKVVKSNVARVVSLMLGMRVVAVNVSIEDVHKTHET